MKYFISHSSKDKSIVDRFVKFLEYNEPEIIKEKNLFYSSVPENGSDFKEELLTNINENISKAENIILIITENYMRSAFCFYELSLARYLKNADRKVILIVQNESIVARVDDIFPSKSFLHINATSENAPAILARSLGYSFDHTVGSDMLLTDFFLPLRDGMLATGTPFIGMTDEDYGLKYHFLEQNGIEKIGFDYPVTPEIMEEKLADAQDIYFVSTTGSGFLKTYKEILSSKVGEGCTLFL